LGWEPRHDFADALDETVGWYLAHQAWVEAIRTSTYDGGRLGLGRQEG
jgi:dTDP-glucose 4,6-dehydratase